MKNIAFNAIKACKKSLKALHFNESIQMMHFLISFLIDSHKNMPNKYAFVKRMQIKGIENMKKLIENMKNKNMDLEIYVL